MNKRKTEDELVDDPKKSKNDDNQDECPVCLKEIQFVERVTTPCSHKFCLPCISEWIEKSNSREIDCPLCRTKFDHYFTVNVDDAGCTAKVNFVYFEEEPEEEEEEPLMYESEDHYDIIEDIDEILDSEEDRSEEEEEEEDVESLREFVIDDEHDIIQIYEHFMHSRPLDTLCNLVTILEDPTDHLRLR